MLCAPPAAWAAVPGSSRLGNGSGTSKVPELRLFWRWESIRRNRAFGNGLFTYARGQHFLRCCGFPSQGVAKAKGRGVMVLPSARPWLMTNGMKHAAPKPHPLTLLPDLRLAKPGVGMIPDVAQCHALWDKYAMLDNVRAHSARVAELAVALAECAAARGFDVNVDAVRACALLHDIAKTFTITHGGSHAQIGASWVIAETGNHYLAQGVMLHVYWPWPVPEEDICTLPFFIIYADKRIKHDRCVPLKDRFEDLLVRYGHTEFSRASIRESYNQGQTIERALSAQLGLELHAYTLDSGRLVQRA